METYYAKIEDNIVTHVEVVTDEFFNANPNRYTGTWKKVGTEQQPYVSKGYVFLPEKDRIIEPQPFKSWILDEKTFEWTAPKVKPEGSFYWDEEVKDWIKVEEK